MGAHVLVARDHHRRADGATRAVFAPSRLPVGHFGDVGELRHRRRVHRPPAVNQHLARGRRASYGPRIRWQRQLAVPAQCEPARRGVGADWPSER